MITVTPATARKAGASVIVTAVLGLLAVLPQIAVAQQLPQQPNAVRQQLAQAGQAAPSATPAKPAQAPKAAIAPAKPAASPQAKPVAAAAAKTATTPAKPASAVTDASAAKKPAAKGDGDVKTAARRDPFSPLYSNQLAAKGTGLPERLPPGIAGLQIATLHIDGIVSGPNGMIAIVSNPQQRVYFLHEGDRLYDGTVQHIGLEMIAFHETGKDPFGKPVDREVSKMLLNATPGEEAP